MIRRVQGDSYTERITAAGIADFTGWSGRWALVPNLGADPLASGMLTVEEGGGALLAHLPAGTTESAEPADYVWVVEVTNQASDYRQEVRQEVFKLGKQGLPAG